MTANKRVTGADNEQRATEYLIDNGYSILERNFRNKTGEIDIIAQNGGCQYKYGCLLAQTLSEQYRRSKKYGYAVEAVSYRKQQIIRQVAMYYLTTRYKSCDIPCRFDVIGIDGTDITHIKNAF